jgi:hypothetical protein
MIVDLLRFAVRNSLRRWRKSYTPRCTPAHRRCTPVVHATALRPRARPKADAVLERERLAQAIIFSVEV